VTLLVSDEKLIVLWNFAGFFPPLRALGICVRAAAWALRKGSCRSDMARLEQGGPQGCKPGLGARRLWDSLPLRDWKAISKRFCKPGSCPGICHLTPKRALEGQTISKEENRATGTFQLHSPHRPRPSNAAADSGATLTKQKVGTESLARTARDHKSTARHRAQKSSTTSSWHGLLCLFLVALARGVMQDKI